MEFSSNYGSGFRTNFIFIDVIKKNKNIKNIPTIIFRLRESYLILQMLNYIGIHINVLQITVYLSTT